LGALGALPLGAAEEPAFSQLTFVDLPLELQVAARRVIVATGARFDRTFGTNVGRMPVSVRLVAAAEVAPSGEEIGGLTGQCVVRDGRAEIRVATRGRAAVGAVLAHEAAHAFAAEAFGGLRDPFLNEGLAQWFAAAAWPPLRNELRHLWLKGGPGVAASPYVAGFHWVEERAGEARFAEFVRASGGAVSKDLEDLEARWRAFVRPRG
jgi:hypothetical protein